MGITGFYWVLPSFTGFYWDNNGFYWVLLSFTGFYRDLLGFTVFFWVLRGFTRFYRVLPGFTGFYWVLLSVHLVPVDRTEIEVSLAVLGSMKRCPIGSDSVGRESPASRPPIGRPWHRGAANGAPPLTGPGRFVDRCSGRRRREIRCLKNVMKYFRIELDFFDPNRITSFLIIYESICILNVL